MFRMKKNTSHEFLSPAQGLVCPLTQVEDPVFAQKMMGDGFAINLQAGEIVAPFDAEVTLAFPTKHAYGLRNKQGVEVLIHLGLDSVKLNGEGFRSMVVVGDQLKQGDVIAIVDLAFIREKGISLVSPIVFPNGEQITLQVKQQPVNKLEKVITIQTT